ADIQMLSPVAPLSVGSAEHRPAQEDIRVIIVEVSGRSSLLGGGPIGLAPASGQLTVGQFVKVFEMERTWKDVAAQLVELPGLRVVRSASRIGYLAGVDGAFQL